MEAIILAGGFGTRLAHIVKDVPKPMAPVANRPFLEYILDYLKKNGISKVVLATGYKHEVIENYFGNVYNDINIEYSVEDMPLFTGGAIKKALKKCTESEVFVINGDTYFNVNLKKMKEFHILHKSDITVATKEMVDIDRYGTLILKDIRIVKFKEKQKKVKGFINGGIYIINRNLFDNIKEEKFSFETNIMEKFVLDLKINSFKCDKYFIDIGIEKDYYTAQQYFSKKKAVFLDRDGVINRDKKYLYKIEDFEFMDGIFKVLKYFQNKEYLIIVITNQAGIGRGYYTEKDFDKLNKWMINEFDSRGIKINKVYYCPTHPTQGIGKYKTESFDRKPNPGMILKAKQEFDINLENSILIGDKDSDIEAGINANIGTNIFVKGIYCVDSKKADICVSSVEEILYKI